MGWLEEQHRKYPFVKMIDDFLDENDFARYGPAHIALDDYNLLDEDINHCLKEIDQTLTGTLLPLDRQDHPGYRHDLLEDTRDVLTRLLEVPERDRIAFMEEYTGDTSDGRMTYTEAIRRIQHLFLQDGDVIVVKVHRDAPIGYIDWLMNTFRREDVARATDKKVTVLVMNDYADVEVRTDGTRSFSQG